MLGCSCSLNLNVLVECLLVMLLPEDSSASAACLSFPILVH
jgi:hypothetical protein